MYCSNCGKKLEKDALFCSGCGKSVSGIQTVEEVKNQGNGRSIASLVLGIIGVLLGLLYLVATLNIERSVIVQIYESTAFRIGYAIGSILLPIICAIVGICLSASARNQNKNGLNTAGLVLSIISFVLCGVITIIVFTV